MTAFGSRSLAARADHAQHNRAALLADIEIDRIVLLTPDPHARFATVELAADFVRAEVLARGYGACGYLFAWDVHRAPVQVPELARFLGGYGDLLLRPDLASLVRWSDRAMVVVCDAEWPDGTPVDVAPRTVLRAELARAEAMGLLVSVGLEHEVTFTDRDGRPLTGPADYALGGTEALAPVLATLRGGIDLGVESARAECHPGQYEIVLRHRDPLAACDDAMLLQHQVRQAAHQHGRLASYLAAQQPGQGSSCHVHLSLSTMDGQSIADERGTGLPARLDWFLAGVLRDAADLTAIWAPTVNSYVRLTTAPFAPKVLRWGTDDRTAAVRLAGRGRSRRLEFRFAGADAQPHLVVAALLAAGLAGIGDRLAAPAEGTVVGELAGTPWQARDRLVGSSRPAALLGPAVVAQQAALLDTELHALVNTVSDVQRTRAALRA